MRAETSHVRRKKIPGGPIQVVLLLFLFSFNLPMSAACSQPVPNKILLCNNMQVALSGWFLPVPAASSHTEAGVPAAANQTAKHALMNWNWLIYAGILLLILYIIRRYELNRVKMKTQMRIANIETVKFKEIDHLKSQFYANISHEFRTPLTLIKGPLEQLIEEDADRKKRKTYKVMHSNVSRLLELINQLLDLSKIENGNYALKASQGDIVNLIEGLSMSYASLSDQNSITLKVKISPELLESEARKEFYFDPEILDKIVNNLISNAFKFTPENGTVTISAGIVTKDQEIKFLEISVQDTGIGIEPDQLSHIFDRFYQVDRSRNPDHEEGTGVGLSIVSELVHVHKGEIEVDSTPGKGTIFRIRIPSGKEHLKPDEIIEITAGKKPDPSPSYFALPKEKTGPETWQYAADINKPWVLVVEDHNQVRNYIIECIQNDYRILQAADASAGFKMAEKSIPDLIISDIMMPGTDGFRLCEQLKNSEKTSHIPIVLLTAKADMKDRINGLKTGADDYLLKPFNAEELRTRTANLIENRKALREKFKTNSIIKPGEISVTPQDTSFIEALLTMVEQNLDNVNYSVEAFAKDAGLSQSQLHRKLRAIINMSAIQFITSVRMHRAMELLQNNAGNISEIAYMVGYDDPGYFSKAFRKFFSKLPSEVSK